MFDYARLYRERNPGAPNPSVQNLVKNTMADYKHEPHDALEDAKALREVVNALQQSPTPEDLSRHSINVECILKMHSIYEY